MACEHPLSAFRVATKPDHIPRTPRTRLELIAVFATLLFVMARSASASPITLTLVPLTESGDPGNALTFDGRITNTTGAALHASDLFLNFDAFDPAILTNINQLLGDTDFLLPNNTISPVVPLFDLVLGAGTGPGVYSISVSLIDINNDLSNAVMGTVTVGAAVPSVPEPSTILLLVPGLSFLIWRS
jgi:hypothetical protein